MSEITRVPLQPVGKGSLTRIWIGVILALLIGATTAWAVRYQGLVVETVKAGSGPSPTLGDVVLVNYAGHLASGKEFDKGEKVAMPVEGVIPGFSKGLQKMQRGEVNVEGIAPMTAVIPNQQRLRADVIGADPLTGGNVLDKVLSNAPAGEHGFFGVPKVIE